RGLAHSRRLLLLRRLRGQGARRTLASATRVGAAGCGRTGSADPGHALVLSGSLGLPQLFGAGSSLADGDVHLHPAVLVTVDRAVELVLARLQCHGQRSRGAGREGVGPLLLDARSLDLQPMCSAAVVLGGERVCAWGERRL